MESCYYILKWNSAKHTIRKSLRDDLNVRSEGQILSTVTAANASMNVISLFFKETYFEKVKVGGEWLLYFSYNISDISLYEYGI